MADRKNISVRWLYKGEKEKWIPFCGNDSILLEEEYFSSQNWRGELRRSVDSSVLVRDGMYTADVKKKVCQPVYWEGSPTVIIRGTWFVETRKGVYQPLPEEEADYIERSHWSEPLRNKLEGGQDETDGTKSSSKSREPLFTAEQVASSSSSHCIAWYGEDDVWLNTKGITNSVTKRVGSLLGNKKKGDLVRAKRLRRGWHTQPSKEDKLPKAIHLVMVIHGIGQALDSSSIVTSAKGLSEACLQEVLGNAPDGEANGRVEFLPVEWRTSLTLDGGLLDRISPPGISQIRKISQLAVCDILYYMSPLYGLEVVNNALNTINKQYRRYVDNHPEFAIDGRVSLLAHSLGSVISYDILATQAWGSKTKWVGQTPSCEERLLFPVENFFAIGSPLSLFLSMRGADSEKKMSRLEDNPFCLPETVCRKMFNIYHPSDPIAFRWEPLISPKYAEIQPVTVSRDSHRTSSSSSTSSLTSDKDEADRPPTVAAASSKSSSLFGSIAGAIGTAITSSKLLTGSVPSDDQRASKTKGSLPESFIPRDKRLPQRYDYALKESFVEHASQYIQAITAHTNYWTSTEVVRFILAHTE
ncbi:uncharacterized protein LOC134194412 [Corticium candelabrum]|uniref:uncharacterized protein LOC134194412 n=1 Tax=Corticium candelabrum TaxID=121492 RepID=UPI002E25D4C8|nr:uncharacterized protein LOC134194412 [Corticium candelabrum]